MSLALAWARRGLDGGSLPLLDTPDSLQFLKTACLRASVTSQLCRATAESYSGHTEGGGLSVPLLTATPLLIPPSSTFCLRTQELVTECTAAAGYTIIPNREGGGGGGGFGGVPAVYSGQVLRTCSNCVRGALERRTPWAEETGMIQRGCSGGNASPLESKR